MREGLEVAQDADSLARLLGGALDWRRAQARESRLRVMQESGATVARVAPVDEITALAAGLNRFSRAVEEVEREGVACFDDCKVCHAEVTEQAPEVVFADRWAAASVMGRGDAF
jgi:cytochrome c5